MSVRSLQFRCFVLMLLLSASRAFAQDTNEDEWKPADNPRHIAYMQGGILTLDEIDAARASSVVEVVSDTKDETLIRHLRIEVFENNTVTTRAQTTLFIVCESRFVLSIAKTGTAKRLQDVTCRFVTLDSAGKSTSSDTWLITYQLHYDEQQGELEWRTRMTIGIKAQRFHNSMPAWVKEKLWLASGFLDHNPGTALVAYELTDKEAVAEFIGVILDFAPGIAKKALTRFIETAINKLSKAALLEAMESDEVQWGSANDITNEKALKHRSQYEPVGKRMWKG